MPVQVGLVWCLLHCRNVVTAVGKQQSGSRTQDQSHACSCIVYQNGRSPFGRTGKPPAVGRLWAVEFGCGSLRQGLGDRVAPDQNRAEAWSRLGPAQEEAEPLVQVRSRAALSGRGLGRKVPWEGLGVVRGRLGKPRAWAGGALGVAVGRTGAAWVGPPKASHCPGPWGPYSCIRTGWQGQREQGWQALLQHCLGEVGTGWSQPQGWVRRWAPQEEETSTPQRLLLLRCGWCGGPPVPDAFPALHGCAADGGWAAVRVHHSGLRGQGVHLIRRDGWRGWTPSSHQPVRPS
mmetsp:Transcript_153291/g.267905  ORF Transcript_153291/g.267905 Transcript_153291/m.267905 type:complete len:290 (+) Transcript_153291:849-1718(+)